MADKDKMNKEQGEWITHPEGIVIADSEDIVIVDKETDKKACAMVAEFVEKIKDYDCEKDWVTGMDELEKKLRKDLNLTEEQALLLMGQGSGMNIEPLFLL